MRIYRKEKEIHIHTASWIGLMSSGNSVETASAGAASPVAMAATFRANFRPDIYTNYVRNVICKQLKCIL